MKKESIALLSTIIVAVSFKSLSAQPFVAKSMPSNFKKEFISISNGSNEKTDTDHSTLYKINIKAIRNFMRRFPTIDNAEWQILKNGYLVIHADSAISKRNYYDKKGNWLYSIDRYDETKLPKTVRAAVKQIYYDYSITIIEEVNTNENRSDPIYLVHMKYIDVFKTVRVSSNEEVTEL